MEDRIDNVIRGAALTKRLIRNEVDPIEKDELNTWLDTDQHRNYLSNLFSRAALDDYTDAVRNYYPQELPEHPEIQKPTINRTAIIRKMFLWAAMLVLMGGGAFYLYRSTRMKPTVNGMPQGEVALSSGSYKATLTLGNGRQLALDESADTNLLLAGTVIQQRNGSIAYNDEHTTSAELHTLETPRGGQWLVVLPDGSQAWLNAASSIKYPTVFSSNTREVEITGEVYFNIKGSPTAPFIVKAPHTTVTVLGTTFNINAYPYDSVVHTTLLSGAIKVMAAGKSRQIYPAQQASATQSLLDVHAVDTFAVTAWKRGYFIFEQVPIRQVMKELENWYDVDVSFADGFQGTTHFSGKISRDTPLATLLDMISQTKTATFEVQGKSVIVKKGR